MSSHITPPDDQELIPLRPDLRFDLGACALLRGDVEIPLSAQEVKLLAILTRSPRRFYSAGHLIGKLRLEDPRDRNTEDGPARCRHRLEQIVSRLRKKLGESGQQPVLLRSRRDIGYAYFPIPAPLPPASSVA